MNLTMRLTRRATCGALTAWMVSQQSFGAPAIISVTLEVDSLEIITRDLKRIRLAAPAEVRFAVLTNFIESVFKDDLAVARNLMKFSVMSHARQVLAEKTLAEVLQSEVMQDVIAAVDLDMARLGVRVQDHTLRFVPVSPPQ